MTDEEEPAAKAIVTFVEPLPMELKIQLDGFLVERCGKTFRMLVRENNPYARQQTTKLAKQAVQTWMTNSIVIEDAEKKAVAGAMFARGLADNIVAYYGYSLRVSL